MILSDNELRDRLYAKPSIVEGCETEIVKFDAETGYRVASYGLGSHGIDCRLSSEGLLLTVRKDDFIAHPFVNSNEDTVTPDLEEDEFGKYVVIPRGQLLLGHLMESFNVPNDLMGVCFGKSSYARMGTHCLMTPLEAGWSGDLVVEISNLRGNKTRVFVEQGICQIVFCEITSPAAVAYNQRPGGGTYQGQTGTTFLSDFSKTIEYPNAECVTTSKFSWVPKHLSATLDDGIFGGR